MNRASALPQEPHHGVPRGSPLGSRLRGLGWSSCERDVQTRPPLAPLVSQWVATVPAAHSPQVGGTPACWVTLHTLGSARAVQAFSQLQLLHLKLVALGPTLSHFPLSTQPWPPAVLGGLVFIPITSLLSPAGFSLPEVFRVNVPFFDIPRAASSHTCPQSSPHSQLSAPPGSACDSLCHLVVPVTVWRALADEGAAHMHAPRLLLCTPAVLCLVRQMQVLGALHPCSVDFSGKWF